MNETPNWFRRLSFLVVGLAIISGGLYANFYSARDRDFLSPVVLGAPKERQPFSPFAGLLGFKSPDLTSVVPGLGQVLGLTDSAPTKTEDSSVKPTSSTPTASTLNSPTTGSGNPAANVSSSNSVNQTSTSDSANSLASSATSPTSGYSSPQQAVEDTSNVVLGYLKNGKYDSLYILMSNDFRNTFSKDDFVGGFSGSTPVTKAQTAGAPKIYGGSSEWAEQTVRLTLADGTSQNYLNIYHWENNAWTLFGTEEQ